MTTERDGMIKVRSVYEAASNIAFNGWSAQMHRNFLLTGTEAKRLLEVTAAVYTTIPTGRQKWVSFLHKGRKRN